MYYFIIDLHCSLIDFLSESHHWKHMKNLSGSLKRLKENYHLLLEKILRANHYSVCVCVCVCVCVHIELVTKSLNIPLCLIKIGQASFWLQAWPPYSWSIYFGKFANNFSFFLWCKFFKGFLPGLQPTKPFSRTCKSSFCIKKGSAPTSQALLHSRNLLLKEEEFTNYLRTSKNCHRVFLCDFFFPSLKPIFLQTMSSKDCVYESQPWTTLCCQQFQVIPALTEHLLNNRHTTLAWSFKLDQDLGHRSEDHTVEWTGHGHGVNFPWN